MVINDHANGLVNVDIVHQFVVVFNKILYFISGIQSYQMIKRMDPVLRFGEYQCQCTGNYIILYTFYTACMSRRQERQHLHTIC